MYTIHLPVRWCSSPSSWMISVPDAGLLPITPRPVWFMNGSITSSGNPCGYVGNAVGVTTPIISQCPVVVSLPFERSTSLPATAGAPGCGGQPSSGITFPSPSASRLGRSSPPTALAVLPRVFEPSSPYSPASGNSPAPTASSTMTHARGTALFYGGFGRRPRPAAPRRVHLRDPRDLGGNHVGGHQDLPDRAEAEESRQAGLVAPSGHGRRRQALPQVEARRDVALRPAGAEREDPRPRRRSPRGRGAR